MVRPRTYPPADSFRYMSVNQIAESIDRTPAQTRKLLDKAAFLGLRPIRRIGKGRPAVYPATAVEVLKAMIGVPHRTIPDPEGDWLSAYEGDTR